MTTISAVFHNDRQLQQPQKADLTQSMCTKFENLGKNISQLDAFLDQFKKPDNELLNPIMRRIFEGICRAFKRIKQDASQINDCHFSGLDQVSTLKPRIHTL